MSSQQEIAKWIHISMTHMYDHPAAHSDSAEGVGTAQPQIVQLQTPQGVVQQLGQMQQLQHVVTPVSAVHQQTQQQAVQQQQQTTVMFQVPSQVVTATASPQPTVVQPTTQVYQQVITPSGEVQSIPIHLTPEQLHQIQMQLQGKASGQSIVIQSSQPAQTQPTDQMAQLTAASQSMFQIQQLPQQAQHIFIQQAEGEEQTEVQEA